MEAAKISETSTHSSKVTKCKHCGQPSFGADYCCSGCASVSDILRQNGEFSVFANTDNVGVHSLILSIEGVHCASCIQLIENALLEEDGVIQARVNMSTKRLTFSWNGDISLGDKLAKKVADLGYKVTPFDASKAKHTDNDEQKMLMRCIGVAGFAMGNIMLFSVPLWSSASEVMGIGTQTFMHWISVLIALPAIAYIGRPFFYSSFNVLKQGHTNMDVPISLAAILASGMSLFETINHGEHIYFDSAIMLLFFLLIGRYLDSRAKGKARESAQDLLAMLEGTATVIEGNKTNIMPIKELREGMRIYLAMGEKVPTDCTIVEGESELDTSLITGETVPQAVTEGELIFAGTINLSAPLVLEVAKASEDSLLSDIVKLMEQAEQGQAKYVRLADKVAKLYTPVVHTLAFLTFLGWWIGMGMVWQEALMVSITVLIITCPCALGLAVPVVQVLASSKLMKHGILIKSGDALEKLASIKHVVFDKTGTLTIGKPTLEDKDISDLQVAASLAVNSRHPYSKAISNAYEGELLKLDDIEEIAGKGMQAKLGGKNIRLGNAEWCSADDATSETKTAQIWLSIEGQEPLAIKLTDPIRDDATEIIHMLVSKGLSVELLSGDRASVVEDTANKLAIENWSAKLTPIDKSNIIQGYVAHNRPVLMVGDGLNDAPSLAAATVSMSPSTAMDITQNTADIVFQGAFLKPIYNVWQVAKQATMLVKQNFAIAVIYNAIAIPLAIMGYVTPLIAAIAMSGSSLLVISNSFRLNWMKD